MKSVFITLASLVAISAVVPAIAQAKQAKNLTCFYQNDSSRLTGYYGSCTEQQVIAAGFSRATVTHPENPDLPPATIATAAARDSGGNGASGGTGGGR